MSPPSHSLGYYRIGDLAIGAMGFKRALHAQQGSCTESLILNSKIGLLTAQGQNISLCPMLSQLLKPVLGFAMRFPCLPCTHATKVRMPIEGTGVLLLFTTVYCAGG